METMFRKVLYGIFNDISRFGKIKRGNIMRYIHQPAIGIAIQQPPLKGAGKVILGSKIGC